MPGPLASRVPPATIDEAIDMPRGRGIHPRGRPAAEPGRESAPQCVSTQLGPSTRRPESSA